MVDDFDLAGGGNTATALMSTSEDDGSWGAESAIIVPDPRSLQTWENCPIPVVRQIF
mgnify:CR=1 FL=1